MSLLHRNFLFQSSLLRYNDAVCLAPNLSMGELAEPETYGSVPEQWTEH